MAGGGEQQQLRVAYQGEAGCYSEAAAAEFFGDELELHGQCVPVEQFSEVFKALFDGRANRAVLPIENVIAGTIHCNLDLIVAHQRVRIVGEYDVAVRHCLLATSSEVHSVRSHYMALAQCGQYLRKHGIKAEVAPDTAGAAREVAEMKNPEGFGAIASIRAAKRYGLKVVAKNIEDQPGNYTRFWVLAREDSDIPIPTAPLANPPEVRGKTSIAFSLENGPGKLVDALLPFHDHHIDMTKIESRPLSSMGNGFAGAHGRKKIARWHYIFYVEIAGSMSDEAVEAAVGLFKEKTAFMRILGSYKRHDAIYVTDC